MQNLTISPLSTLLQVRVLGALCRNGPADAVLNRVGY